MPELEIEFNLNPKEVPDNLKEALSFLQKNGDFSKIQAFLKQQGSHELYKLDELDLQRLRKGLRLCFRRMYQFRNTSEEDRDVAFFHLQVLKNAGLLSESLLQKEFNTYLSSRDEEEPFTAEEISTLKQKIKESLGWNLVI